MSVRILAVSAVVLATLGIAAADQKKSNAKAAQIKRGEYLMTVALCHDCHTPKIDAQGTPDMTRKFSGRPQSSVPPAQAENEVRSSLDLTAWSGPWGVSYSANLTPDPTTGIGKRYDEAKFIQAMRTGKKPEGEPLLPPMPWPMIGKMTDDDLKAIYAYLQTLPPIKNNVKASPVMK
jgi:cytochrome c553